MKPRLLTSNYIKVCISNLFLFTSLYLVLPILPFALKGLNSTTANWHILLFFTLGMLLGGPSHNYFIESKSRKKVCTWSILGIVLPTLLYLLNNATLLHNAAALVQGFCFGLATAASVTIAIDVTDTQKRSKGNLIYAWAGRAGMIIAIPAGIIIFSNYGFSQLIYTSIIASFLALFFNLRTKTPFRAPIGAKAFSCDRFILPSGWKLVLMMATLAFILGSIFPLFMADMTLEENYLSHQIIEFVLLPFLVFLGSALLARLEIDALYHHKPLSFIILRTPLVAISIYLISAYSDSLTSLNKGLILLLVVSFLLTFVRGIFHKRIKREINKWQLTPNIRTEFTSPIMSGLICMALALSLQQETLVFNHYESYRVIILLLFFGLARISSPILLLLIVTSRHCERSTANTSHIIAWEVGLALGCASTLVFKLNEMEVLNGTFIALLTILLLYIIVYTELRRKMKRHIVNMKVKRVKKKKLKK